MTYFCKGCNKELNLLKSMGDNPKTGKAYKAFCSGCWVSLGGVVGQVLEINNKRSNLI